MERTIESAVQQTDQREEVLPGSAGRASARVAEHAPLLAAGPLGARDFGIGILAGAGFFALALACITLSSFDSALASVWFPNASAVGLLLLARPRNEVPTIQKTAAATQGPDRPHFAACSTKESGGAHRAPPLCCSGNRRLTN